MLFFALLLVAASDDYDNLIIWAAKVLSEKGEAEAARQAWSPRLDATGVAGWPMFNKVSTLFTPMKAAYAETTWSEAVLNKIGVAIQLWRGDGQRAGLRSVQ